MSRTSALLLACFSIAGCAASTSTSTADDDLGSSNEALTTSSAVDADDTCPNGGRRVDSGINADGDEVLDPEEVTSSHVVCAREKDAPRIVFVSSEDYGADFGGVAVADAKCQALADAVPALAGKSFKAFLSQSDSSVLSRFALDGSFVLVDGTAVASSWEDLFEASHWYSSQILINPIGLTEKGIEKNGDTWSATSKEGGYEGNGDCGGWTSTASDKGWIFADGLTTGGFAGQDVVSDDWYSNRRMRCSFQLPLLCFEQ